MTWTNTYGRTCPVCGAGAGQPHRSTRVPGIENRPTLTPREQRPTEELDDHDDA